MTSSQASAVLTVNEMYAADSAAIHSGTPGIQLMTNAGNAIVDLILPSLRENDRILVVCGTGNNGGDGFVIAQRLHTLKIPVDVVLCGEIAAVKGDALLALQTLAQPPAPFAANNLRNCTVVIDALVGAGLSRNLSGEMATIISAINQTSASRQIRVISVDLPSGINGDTGQVCGDAINADQTVTFFRKKPGHLLYPGRTHCGVLSVVQIGIDAIVLNGRASAITENDPAWWIDYCPWPVSESHKYSRGHAVVLSGGKTSTGAARMACEAALRSGAGLVTLCCRENALAENAAHLTAIMLKHIETPEQLRQYLKDERISSITLGPGSGVSDNTRQLVRMALMARRPVVLDADALTSFEHQPEVLFDMIRNTTHAVVLTPHAGEFKRLFASKAVSDSTSDKITLARQAAKVSGAIVIFKGPDTVIATPDGSVVINTNAPPWLATAGSGDVLAGTIAGWLAQGMDAFFAACAACWIHAESASQFGPGLIATDIAAGYPKLLRSLMPDSTHL